MRAHPFSGSTRLPRLGAVLLAALLAAPAVAIVVPAVASAQLPAAANVVVVRVGDGSAALSGTAAPVFLDEIGPDGTPVRSTPLPTTANGADQPLTMSGSATSEGALALSGDGRYLTLTGYGAAPGTAAVAGTSSATVPRVVARVDAAGAVDTTTALADAASGSSARTAVSDDGSRFWFGGGAGGVRFAPLGATTSTQLAAAPTNVRTLGIADGQLHLGSGSAPFVGVSRVGTGLPTTAGQTVSLFAAGSSPYAFQFLDRSTAVPGVDSLYVADDSSAGGLLKFSFDGTTWTALGVFRPAGAAARGVTGRVEVDGSAGLVATTSTGQVVRVADTAAFDVPIAATGALLAAAPPNTAYRGIAFAPQGATPAPTPTPAPPTPTPGPPTPTPVPTPTPPACTTTAATVGSVQGTGDISPVAGQTVTVRGTVVADYEGPQPALRGFYLQDAGDGDPATSDGIFVFQNTTDAVTNGAVVQVTGPASEFQGQTQIAPPAGGVQLCGTQGTVVPADITLPRASATDLEPFEGMLVRLAQTATVTESFQLGRFGQVVLSSGGKLYQPTSLFPASNQAAVQAQQVANNLNRLILDDATQAQNPDPIVFGRVGQPLSAGNTLRGGDTVTGAVGVLTYTWAGNAASGNAYRLRPVGALGGTAVFEPVNPRPTAPPAVGDGGLRVANANLLNFFNTFSGCTFGVGGAAADCRGAGDAVEYERQLAKEVDSITFLDADVVGIQEVENDGYGPGSATQALTDALNAKDGAGAWAFVDPDAATGVLNVAGDDAIKAGLLYRTAAVTPVPGATFVDQAGDLFERRPVAQTFATTAGGRVTVVANHFKSKGCGTGAPADLDQGDGQGCFNARRTAQAAELARWLDEDVVPAADDPDVLIVGDLNSYAGEDPIAVLEAAGYVNLPRVFGGAAAYSYVFDGQWGYLDHALASPSLRAQVTGAGDAHHNADEPTVLDYNTDFKSPAQIAALYAPDRFRTSDHDPVLVGIELVPDTNDAPVLAPVPAQAVRWGNVLTVGVSASDADGDLLTYSLVDAPAGATIDPATGVVTFAPSSSQVGALTLTAAVSDGELTVTTPVAVTVEKRPTRLVYSGAATGQFSDPATVAATLTDDGGQALQGQPIDGASVAFTIGTQTATAQTATTPTGAAGIAQASITPAHPAGSSAVASTFAGDGRYLAAGDSDAFTITAENATLAYTGPRASISINRPVPLSGSVTEAADGTLGDRAAATQLRFTVRRWGGTAVVATCTASVTWTGPASGSGTCGVALGVIGAYRVTVELVGNGYYTAPPAQSPTLILIRVP